MTNSEHTETTTHQTGSGTGSRNERDIEIKQEYDVASSSAVSGDDDVDAEDVKVLPGTGGPDDVGDVELDPKDYDPTGHAG
ncbi:MAG: hypothetical protein H7146_10795, partial [Burkholderiaceae bacterium]|nr:hypothetical protein [Microbacteriaceae bacterium]